MPVTATEALGIARDWVAANAADIRGFSGAYTVGSVNTMPPGAPLPPTSDLDVMVVVDIPDAPPKPGKMMVNGVLLEVTYLSMDDVADVQRVLGHYHLAPGVATARILADPSGRLETLRRETRRSFDDPEWIGRRVGMARDTVLERVGGIDSAAPLHVQAMSVLFAAGGVPHILLVAAGRNPTVRKRFEATRTLLEETGRGGDYGGLVALLGAKDITPATASRHLDALEGVFDATGSVIRSPVPFATDLMPQSRPLAIDGSREAIRSGYHREAMFWIAVTFTRCMTVLHADAPGLLPEMEPGYLAVLGDLGIAGPDDIAARGESIRAALPDVESLARELTPQALSSSTSLS
jgi:hypothetical protein